MDVEQSIEAALELHRKGELQLAEQDYRAILDHDPRQSDVLCLLGGLANQTGRPKEAITLINQAIRIEPLAEYYFDLAHPHIALGEHAQAIKALQQAIVLDPEWADAHALLAVAFQSLAQIEKVIESYQAAIKLEPHHPEWHFNLGNAFLLANRREQAVASFTESLRLNPREAGVLNNLGQTLFRMGRFDEAAEKIRLALEINPSFPAALHNLGRILVAQNRFEESLDPFHQAIDLQPAMAAVYLHLGDALQHLARFAEAIEIYRRGSTLNAEWPELLAHLSHALCQIGDMDGAIRAGREALECRPGDRLARENLASALRLRNLDLSVQMYDELAADYPDDATILNARAHLLHLAGREESLTVFQRAAELDPGQFRYASNYLFALQFREEDPVRILDAHRQFDARYAAPFRDNIRPFENDRNPHRRLRIGYLSPDFCGHCQSLFTSPLFLHHDHEQFEVFCYSTVPVADFVTARLSQCADVWRQVNLLSDQDLSERIRADGIDILVDLTMHMHRSRPMLFARKPSPVQVAWLAYPGTTGLTAMDYRLTDPHLDPPGFDHRYTERSIRLPETFWCYDPRGACLSEGEWLPEPGPLPAEKNRYITFGCLNDFVKFNLATLQRWGRLMQSVERSHIRLLVHPGRSRDRVLDSLRPFGVAADRVEFVERQPRPPYLAEYRRIDLCLDTLPYNGHTTSLDAFWMGTPVMTQIGRTVVGRAGFSQLMNLGLDGFVAETDEQFIALGQRWANDLPALSEIRRTLRDQMIASPLMDPRKFAGRMESAYRQMWHDFTQHVPVTRAVSASR